MKKFMTALCCICLFRQVGTRPMGSDRPGNLAQGIINAAQEYCPRPRRPAIWSKFSGDGKDLPAGQGVL